MEFVSQLENKKLCRQTQEVRSGRTCYSMHPETELANPLNLLTKWINVLVALATRISRAFPVPGILVTTEKCLQALDQSDWDVMKAIKILKLQNVVSADLTACFNALENSMWDITKAAQWILQQDGEVTQV